MGLFSGIRLGPLKSLEDITIHDMMQYPIWVEDLSGESRDDFDETAQRPVTNTRDVTTKMLREYVKVNVLIEIEGTDILASADVEEDASLSGLVAWIDDSWIDLNKHIDDSVAIYVRPVPSILGRKARYEYMHQEDIAIEKSVT